jgi:hypothetical protein
MAETRRHTWTPTGRTKECGSCHLQAVGRVQDSAGAWQSVWQAGGVSFASTRTPVCGEPLPTPAPPAERAQLATDADRAAHAAYQAGELDRAAHLVQVARVLDGSRSELWDRRDAGIRRAIERTADKTESKSLDLIVRERLAAAGIGPDDPGLRFWRDWNAKAMERELEAGL